MTPEEKAQLSELEAACRKKTIEGMKTILELMQKADKDSVRLHAAIFVIERGWGKAIQPNEHSGRNGKPIDHHITVEIIKGSAPIGGISADSVMSSVKATDRAAN